ncbi:uncharacterized protein LOC133288691 [Gastrolobium bilobum]|uniref:uncharacterized protein LOC133288691 n=1 Tax=Gastrolobium bilobum TaxID=150636 RepID=UPI002AB211DB|nr:uncharacterized protein LOC133288691 [Gastrolobium bilobum]
MTVLFWNCRGEAKKELGRLLNSLVVKHRLQMVVLLEPRTQSKSYVSLMKKIKFDKYWVEEANGFSGGIRILWSSAWGNVDVRNQTNQMIHMNISLSSNQSFLCTAIYGSPREVERNTLWDDLKNLSRSIQEPWLVGGDFNEIATVQEKIGGSAPNLSKCDLFASVLEDCNLGDLAFLDLYSRGRAPNGEIREGCIRDFIEWLQTYNGV